MTELEKIQDEFIHSLVCQLMDISMMSKIELGDDVIVEYNHLQDKIKELKNKI